MVHVLPHWNWEGWEGKEIPVQAYTNADSVELFLNGKSLGTKKGSADLNRTLHYEWKVPYAPGTLKAVAKKDGKVVATDEVVTAGTAGEAGAEGRSLGDQCRRRRHELRHRASLGQGWSHLPER